jgi:hypothetical protein
MGVLLYTYHLSKGEEMGSGLNGDVFDCILPDSIVRVIYSDETGIGNVKEEPIAVVVAVMFNMDTQWTPVTAEITAAVHKSQSRRKLLKENSEISGQLLYKALRSGRHPEAKEFLTDLLVIPYKLHIPIFYGAVDRIRFNNRSGPPRGDWTPQDVAFDICLEKVDQYVNTLLPKENVIWISDTTGKQKRLKHGLLTYQIFETIKFGPDNKLSPHTARIVDTIYFGDSKESRFLQLADYVVRR